MCMRRHKKFMTKNVPSKSIICVIKTFLHHFCIFNSIVDLHYRFLLKTHFHFINTKRIPNFRYLFLIAFCAYNSHIIFI
jgi:hypothetical protein